MSGRLLDSLELYLLTGYDDDEQQRVWLMENAVPFRHDGDKLLVTSSSLATVEELDAGDASP